MDRKDIVENCKRGAETAEFPSVRIDGVSPHPVLTIRGDEVVLSEHFYSLPPEQRVEVLQRVRTVYPDIDVEAA